MQSVFELGADGEVRIIGAAISDNARGLSARFSSAAFLNGLLKVAWVGSKRPQR